MSYAPYLIANYTDGLDRDQQPWLLPEQAFTDIENAYLRHGTVNKREGREFFGKLAHADPLNLNQVTGISKFINGSGVVDIIATDITTSYKYNTGTQVFDTLGADSPWTSSNYVWFAGYGVTGSVTANALYMTNNVDRIKKYISGGATTDVDINYSVNGATAGQTVTACLLIFVLKNRLLLLNTLEAGQLKPQRARWSQAQNPDVWDQITPGRGGFVDCPTSDFIIGAKYLQEYLIVFFSNSTWTLKPTADPALPFRWDRVNSFRASDATFGNVGHDRYVISYGKTGIIACDGVEVKRIDDKIQDFVFSQVNVNKFDLIFSDRNYQARRSWTLFPDIESDINNYALIRNEEDGSWSTYAMPVGGELACLGQGESSVDLAFDDFVAPDKDYSFDSADLNEATFLSYYQQGESNLLLGGDYKNNVYILDVGGADDVGQDEANQADISFSITGAGWNPFKDKGIEAQLGYIDIYADVNPNTTLTVSFFINDGISPYAQQDMTLVPQNGFIGTIEDVSTTNPCQVTSSSHGLRTGNQVYLSGIFGTLPVVTPPITSVNGGPYTVTVIDENTFSLDGINGTLFATSYSHSGQITEYNPDEFDKTWLRVYAGGIGYLHSVKLETSGSNQTVQIQSITPWFRPVGSRMIS
jgi:hypothetical protein